jgi:hypothetical protein
MELKKADRFNPILIWFLSAFYKIYLLTLRKKVVFSPEFEDYLKTKKPVLLSFWHQDVNTLLYITWKFTTLSMISDSKDGQLVAQVMEQMGSVAARGSSRTNPVKALKGFIRLMRTGKYWASVAVDGPKGPPKKAKSGIVESARIFKCPIFSVSAAYSSKWTLKKSWDNTIIAKPFSKVVFYFGPALEEVTKDMDPKNPELLARLDESMSRNQNLALGYLNKKS